MNNRINQIRLTFASTAIALSLSASALANSLTTYSTGDLFVGFRQEGVANSLAVNLGPATRYLPPSLGGTALPGTSFNAQFGVTPGTSNAVTSLAADLAAVFGAGWANNPTNASGVGNGKGVRWAVVGFTDNSIDNRPIEGLRARSIFVTKARSNPANQSVPLGSVVHNNFANAFDPFVSAIGGGSYINQTPTTNSSAAYKGQSEDRNNWASRIDDEGTGSFGLGSLLRVEQAASGNFTGPTDSVLDLYLAPRAGSALASSNTYLGNFRLNTDGTLQFRAAGTETNAPVVTTTANLSAFTASFGSASAAQSIFVSGYNLSSTIIVQAPAQFQVSLDGTNFSDSISSPAPASGVVRSTRVHLRVNSSAPLGAVGGNIIVSSTGVASQNIPVSGSVNAAPSLTIGGTPLSAFTASSGVVSSSQSFTVAGAALTGNVSVSAPAGFELSSNNGTNFAPSLTLTPSSGALASQTIQVRISSLAQSGALTGNIVVSSPGAAAQNIAVSGTVTTVTVPVITSPGTATATRGTPFSYQITAAGAQVLEYFLTGALPAGLTFDKPNGRITGTPTAAAGTFPVVLAARNSNGRSANFPLAITVANPPAPVITGVSTAGNAPFSAYNGLPAPTLSVSVNNPQNHPLRYQWRLNGGNIRGATQPTYNIASASAASVGSYDVVVSNFAGVNATSPALAFALRPAATFSVEGPRNQTIAAGGQAQFSANVTDAPPGSALNYQWFRNGAAIAGATNSSYSLPGGVSAATAGAYTLTVTSRIGRTVVGSVSTAPWSVVLDDSGILVYRITTSSGFNTTGPREVAARLSGYLLIDRKNGNAAIVETYGVAAARRNRLQLRNDVAAYSTGPVAGSRTVFAGSVNGGNNRVDHDILWLVGADAFLTVAPARTTAPVARAVTLFAPSALKGFIGTVGSQPEFGIDNYEVTLAIDNALTAQAYRAGDNLEQTIVKVRAAAALAGFPNE